MLLCTRDGGAVEALQSQNALVPGPQIWPIRGDIFHSENGVRGLAQDAEGP